MTLPSLPLCDLLHMRGLRSYVIIWVLECCFLAGGFGCVSASCNLYQSYGSDEAMPSDSRFLSLKTWAPFHTPHMQLGGERNIEKTPKVWRKAQDNSGLEKLKIMGMWGQTQDLGQQRPSWCPGRIKQRQWREILLLLKGRRLEDCTGRRNTDLEMFSRRISVYDLPVMRIVIKSANFSIPKGHTLPTAFHPFHILPWLLLSEPNLHFTGERTWGPECGDWIQGRLPLSSA